MTFATDMTKFCRDIAPAYVAKTIRRTVIEIGARAVERSPVGDALYWSRPAPPGYVGGRFRGNWQYGVGSAPSGELDRIDAGGNATVADITGGVMASRASGVHYVVNNLPYAERIENGWSRQAPEGIVSLLELEFQSIFESAKRA